MCRRNHWSNESKRLCDVTVRLQTSAPYMITGMMHPLYNLILDDRDIQESQILRSRIFMQPRASSILLWTSWSFSPLESIQDPRYTNETTLCVMIAYYRAPEVFSLSILSLCLFDFITCNSMNCTGWAKKRGHGLIAIILSNLKRFQKLFLLEDTLVNLQLNGY